MSQSLGDLLLKIGPELDSWKDLKDTLKDTKADLVEFSEDVHKIGAVFDVAFTLPVVAAGAALFKFGTDYEGARNKIISGTGAIGAELDGLQHSFENAFQRGDESASEVAATITELHTVLDLTGPALENLTVKMHDLSDVTGETLAPMVDSLAHAFSNWRLDTEAQSKALDYLMQVSMASGAKVTTLAQTLTQMGPTLRDLGIGFNDAAAMIGQLSKAGVDAAPILSGLNKAMLTLTKAGIKDPLEAMQLFAGGIREAATSAEAMELASKIFGKASASMVDAVRTGKVNFDSWAGSLKLSTRTVSETADEVKTISQRIGELTNQLEHDFGPMGEAIVKTFEDMLDAARPVVEMLGDMAHWFEGLDTSTKVFILGMGGLAAAIGPVLGALGLMVRGITELIDLVPAASQLLGTNFGSALLAVAKGATLAAAAFAGFKLGEWLEKNIPILHEFSVAFAEFLVKIPGAQTAINYLSGAVREQTEATQASLFVMQKQEEALAKVGVTIKKAGVSTEQYALALKEAIQFLNDHTKAANSDATATASGGAAAKMSAADHAKLAAGIKAVTNQLNAKEIAAKKAKDAEEALRREDQELEDSHKRWMEAFKEQVKAAEELQKEQEKMAALMAKINDEVDSEVKKNTLKEYGDMWKVTAEQVKAAGGSLSIDFAKLGVNTSELKKNYQDANAELAKMNALVDSSGHSIFSQTELMTAQLTVFEKQIALNKAYGQDTTDLEEKVHRLKVATGLELSEMQIAWKGFREGVSQTMANFSSDIVGSIWNGDIKGALDNVKAGFLKTFQDLASSILNTFIKKVLLGDLTGALNSVTASINNMGKEFTKIVGSVAPAAAENVAGGAKTATGAASAAQAGTGLLGAINAITGVVSAITGVLSYLQGRRMEQDIGRIEVTSRGIFNTVSNRNHEAWDQHNLLIAELETLKDPINAYHTVLDASWTALDEMRNLLKAGVKIDSENTDKVVDAVKETSTATNDDDVTTQLVILNATTQNVTDAVDALSTNIYSDVGGAADTLTEAAQPVADAADKLAAAVDSEEYEKAKLAGTLAQTNDTVKSLNTATGGMTSAATSLSSAARSVSSATAGLSAAADEITVAIPSKSKPNYDVTPARLSPVGGDAFAPTPDNRYTAAPAVAPAAAMVTFWITGNQISSQKAADDLMNTAMDKLRRNSGLKL